MAEVSVWRNYPFKFIHITTNIPNTFLDYEFLVVHMIYSVISLGKPKCYVFTCLWLCFLVGVLQNSYYFLSNKGKISQKSSLAVL